MAVQDLLEQGLIEALDVGPASESFVLRGQLPIAR